MVFSGIFSIPVDQSYNNERKISLTNTDDEYIFISHLEANSLVDKNLISRNGSIFSFRGNGNERIPGESQLQLKDKIRKESILPKNAILKNSKNEKISSILSESWRNKLIYLKSSTENEIAIKIKSISPKKKVKFSELFKASPNAKKHSSAMKVDNSMIFNASAITLYSELNEKAL